MTAVDGAQIAGAVGTCVAAIAAAVIYYLQNSDQQRRDKRADAAVLLSLQDLASELRRMNLLAGYQLDQPGNDLIYPDIAAAFATISETLDRLPIERISILGKMQVLLHLRSISAELRMLYTPAPQPGGGFYLKNRERLTKLEKECSAHSIQLMKEIENVDEDTYRAHAVRMNTL